jgi:epoxyqueuosine reductase
MAEARTLGFDACRIAAPQLSEATRSHLAAWLAEGQHGQMAWILEIFARRADPKTLWPRVCSVVMLAMKLWPRRRSARGDTPLRRRDDFRLRASSRLSRSDQKGRLKTLAGWLVAAAGEGAEVKIFVDTAPVMEKPWRRRPVSDGRASTPIW